MIKVYLLKTISNPFLNSINPMLSWMPLTTTRGKNLTTTVIRLVRDRSSKIAPINRPAVPIMLAERPSEMAIAAIAFIGCTGVGMR